MKVLVITGTPGVGKSTFAAFLKKRLGFEQLHLEEPYAEIAAGYNQKKQCYEVDVRKFVRLVQKRITVLKKEKKKGLIIDSHIAHLLPKKLIDLCVVLICSDLKKLKRRLEKRGYHKSKVRENLDAEIFQVCLMEAQEQGHKVLVVDTGKRMDKEEVVRKVRRTLKA